MAMSCGLVLNFTEFSIAEEDKQAGAVDVGDGMATSSSSSKKSDKREMAEHGNDYDEEGAESLPQLGQLTRANTEATLVGPNEENEGSAVKASHFVHVDDHVVIS